MPRSPRYRNYCFTLNNYTEDEINLLMLSDYSYMIFGYEIGENGTPHLQGYIEFDDKMTIVGIKKHLGIDRIHLESRRGTQEEAINYCKKDNDFYEHGTLKCQGKRTDLENIYEDINSGKTVFDIATNYPSQYIRYSKGIEKLKNVIEQKRMTSIRNINVTVIVGTPGAGKTRHVYDSHGFENVYKLDAHDKNLWFDGYDGQDVLLIDDFYGGIKFGFLLNLLDIYPIRLPIKGGFTWANWTKIYITSNSDVKSWYSVPNMDALTRRIHSTIRLGKKGPEVSGNTVPTLENSNLDLGIE